MRSLQTLHNKTLRLQYGLDRSTSTETLMAATNSLSVHQLAAKCCLVQVYNIYKTKKPAYHYNRLFPDANVSLRSTSNIQTRVEFSKALCKGGFFFQSSRLWSSLPLNIKTSSTVQAFKSKIKKWVQQNISLKL